jgi:uncharacterized protein (DUF924 family)
MQDPEALLQFWLEEIGPDGWYRQDTDLDARIRTEYEPLWRAAQREDRLGWTTMPRGTLALLVLLDQFPRNMFRGDAAAFSTDGMARAVAKKAIERGWDLRIDPPARQFFYLPLMHSECLADQERCVRLMKDRMPREGEDNLLHARAHREVIRRFGRFPHRNADLGRSSTAAEVTFLESGGYGGLVRALQVPAAAGMESR